MGDVVLGELLKERGLAPKPAASADVFLVAVSAEDRPAALQLAHLLREHELRVEYALSEEKVGQRTQQGYFPAPTLSSFGKI